MNRDCDVLVVGSGAAGLVAAVGPAGLEGTVARLNADPGRGIDRAFGKGDSEYNRFMGDPGHARTAASRASRSARR